MLSGTMHTPHPHCLMICLWTPGTHACLRLPRTPTASLLLRFLLRLPMFSCFLFAVVVWTSRQLRRRFEPLHCTYHQIVFLKLHWTAFSVDWWPIALLQDSGIVVCVLELARFIETFWRARRTRDRWYGHRQESRLIQKRSRGHRRGSAMT